MDLSTLNLDELKTLADSFEAFEYDKRLGEDKLREKLAEYIEANPEVLNENSDSEDSDIVPEDGNENEGENSEPENSDSGDSGEGVKITSIHRGKITCSAGEFEINEKGYAVVSKEIADVITQINGYDKC